MTFIFLLESFKMIVLKEQIPHISRIKTILVRSRVYIDASPPGTGKTYCALQIAKDFGLDVLIVCPKTIIENWREIAGEFGVKIVDILNYHSLRNGNKYLSCTSSVGINKEYQVTDYFCDLVDQGIMLIFDEGQSTKNLSQQFKAASKLTGYIANLEQTSSIFTLLSGTLFSDESNPTNLVQVLGLASGRILTGTGRNEKATHYFDELLDNCRKIDLILTNTVVHRSANQAPSAVAYQLMMRVIKQSLVSSMPLSEASYKKEIYNAFYDLSPEQEEKFSSSLNELIRSTQFFEGRVKKRISASQTLRLMELAKVDLFARLANEELNKNPNTKVIISLNYLDSIRMLTPQFRKFGLGLIQGSCETEDRKRTIDRFNEPNTKMRVLLCTSRTGSVGISLHDTDGKFPRVMLISPSHFLDYQYQCTFRICRVGTKSDTKVVFVYGVSSKRNFDLEMRIISALEIKSGVLREFSDFGDQEQMLYPGDYPCKRFSIKNNKYIEFK